MGLEIYCKTKTMMTEKEKHDYVEMGFMLFLAQIAIFALLVALIIVKLKPCA